MLCAQRRYLGHFSGECAIEVFLRQQATLQFAAGGLRDALYRHHMRHFEASMLVDHARHGIGGRQEIFHGPSVQHKQRQFVRFGAIRATGRCHYLAEFQTWRADGDVLEVVRVVVLAVDEDNFLRTARDDDFTLVIQAEVASIEPAIGSDDAGVHVR